MNDQSFEQDFDRISRALPELARELIPRSPSATAAWRANPDGVREHKPEWHQWGIVTHSRLFAEKLRSEVPEAFRQVSPAIAATLAERGDKTIDSLSRRNLMQIAGLWHDLGKFATRTKSRRGGYNFIGHADVSGAIIRDGLGAREGFTPAQVEYLARLAELHFAPMEFKLSLQGKKQADSASLYRRIADQLGELGYEIMAMFWADTLAKGSTPRQKQDRPLLWRVFEQGLLAIDAHGKAGSPLSASR